MQCTRPQTMDYHKGGHKVPCGYCPACRYNQRVGWTFRISEQAKHSKEAWFITLTYDEENIPILSAEGEILRGSDKNRSDRMESLDVEDVVRFINSVKKRQKRTYRDFINTALTPSEAIAEPKISYYLVGEYGGKYGRPHYHLIVFNLWQSIAKELELEKIWKKGRIETESANPRLIHYITGYLHEKSDYVKDKQVKPFMRCSKGLGEQYVQRAKKYHKDTLNPWIWFNGHKIAMPQYLRDKIFTESENEIIKQKIQEWNTKEEEPPLLEETKHSRKQWEHTINYRSRQNRKF